MIFGQKKDAALAASSSLFVCFCILNIMQAAVDRAQATIYRVDIDVLAAVVHVLLKLPLHPLQGIINGLHMPVQINSNLLIGFAIEIRHEHLPLEIAEDFLHAGLDVHKFFTADYKFLRIRYLGPGKNIEQGTILILIINLLIQGNIGIERYMLLPCCRLDRRNDLARNAKLGKSAKR